MHYMYYMLKSIFLMIQKGITLTLVDNLFYNFLEALILWNDLILVLQMVPTILLIDFISCKYDLIVEKE